jgi:hypothetical protein
MIASGRGIEIGFAAAIHTSQFSAASVKRKLRSVTPALFRLLPAPSSDLVRQLSENLQQSGGWAYRERTRLEPGAQNFATLGELIVDLQQPRGLKRGAGSVSKYFNINALDDPSLSLEREFRNCTQLFCRLWSSFEDVMLLEKISY